LGLSGRIPRRVGAATKTSLLELVDVAVEAGWTVRGVCEVLEVNELRTYR